MCNVVKSLESVILASFEQVGSSFPLRSLFFLSVLFYSTRLFLILSPARQQLAVLSLLMLSVVGVFNGRHILDDREVEVPKKRK